MVSIGIPFLNAEDTLGDAVQSVLCQTWEDWELLLVDDGSTDRSLDIAHSFEDPRIRVLSDGRNRGLVDRLNQIADTARAELVARMDADDLMHPERIRRQAEEFALREELDILSTGAYVIDEHGDIVGRRSTANGGRLDVTKAVRTIIHPSVMYRRAWIRHHRYNARFVRCEDFELWCRALPTSTYVHIPEPLLFYRDPSRIRIVPYRMSLKSGRAALREHGHEVFGALWTGALLIRSILREAIGVSLHALRSDHVLTRWRNDALAKETLAEAERTLAALLTVPKRIPGCEQ